MSGVLYSSRISRPVFYVAGLPTGRKTGYETKHTGKLLYALKKICEGIIHLMLDKRKTRTGERKRDKRPVGISEINESEVGETSERDTALRGGGHKGALR